MKWERWGWVELDFKNSLQSWYTDLYMTRQRRKHDELFKFRIFIKNQYRWVRYVKDDKKSRVTDLTVNRLLNYGTLTLSHIQILSKYDRVVLSNVSKEAVDRSSSYRKLSITIDEERMQITPLDMYLYIPPLWYCSVEWLQSDCTPEEILIRLQ